MGGVLRVFGVIVSAALLWLLALPAVSSASVKTECCFDVEAYAEANVNVTWSNPQPPAPKAVHTGSEQFESSWATIEVDEYGESGGYPSLERAALNSKEIPGLEVSTYSTAKGNERYWAPGVTTPD